MWKQSNRRILVDGIWLGREMKGVGRYTSNVLWHLSRSTPMNQYWVLVRKEAQLPAVPLGPNFVYLPIHYRNHYLHGLWNLPRQARGLRVDQAWIPYEATLSSFPCSYSMVCHDVPERISSAKREGGERPSPIRSWIEGLDFLLARRSLRRASVVFSNSHYVREWLKQRAGVSPDRIRYAPCAPGTDFISLTRDLNREEIRRRMGSPEGSLLVFYTGDRRENLSVIPSVFQKIIEAGFPHRLWVAGVRRETLAYVKSVFSGFLWRDRVRIIPFLGTGSEKELAEVYAAASVFLDPSLHEGFGMQVIEAMACGTPVVCSNRGALPEVAGSAALLVNPNHPGEIAAALIRLLSDPELKDRMVSWGRKQAATFSWERTARVIAQELMTLHPPAVNSPLKDKRPSLSPGS